MIFPLTNMFKDMPTLLTPYLRCIQNNYRPGLSSSTVKVTINIWRNQDQCTDKDEAAAAAALFNNVWMSRTSNYHPFEILGYRFIRRYL